MKLRRAGWFGCVAVLFAVLFVGCSGGDKPGAGGSQGGKKRFIVLINTPNPFWDTCNAGVKEAAKELKLEEAGITVTMEANDGTAKGQVDKLRQYASQPDIAGIAITVIQADNKAIIKEMKNLQEKGVKVITFDADVDEKNRDARPYYIGTNNMIAGQTLGKATRAILHEKGVKEGGYVQFAGITTNDNARLRMDGFKEGVGEEYTEIDRMPDGADSNKITKAQKNVEDAIINHKDKVNCLVGIWAYNGPAISYVVDKRKEREKFVCVTFDADQDSLKSMGEGGLSCLCVQDPFDMGKQSVRLLKAMHEKDEATIAEMFPHHGEPGGDIYTTGLRIVVPDANSPVKADMFGNDVQFMTLEEMKAWLKKYNLVSS